MQSSGPTNENMDFNFIYLLYLLVEMKCIYLITHYVLAQGCHLREQIKESKREY